VERLPLILHEDDDLLVVNKPPGWNTHAPDPYAGEGVFDWLRNREPRWAGLSILHRLDQVTSGVLVFGKSARANRSLAEQFDQRRVRKKYVLLSTQPGPADELVIRSGIVRDGERYRAVSGGVGLPAETGFRAAGRSGRWHCVEAEPATGRTHQIRVHAAEAGFPVLGDIRYGGAPFPRVCLHAAGLGFQHPADEAFRTFIAPADFSAPPAHALRRAFMDPVLTDAFRLVHGAADGDPGWFVERLGDWLLSESEAADLSAVRREALAGWLKTEGARGVFHKPLDRHVRRRDPAEAAPRLLIGEAPAGEFLVRENGLRFELAFDRGYSYGLFLDQRDNRRRLLRNHVAAGFPAPLAQSGGRRLLNLFAYTCGFSVAAAAAGWETTSLDLSRHYLDWGRANFRCNDLTPDAHDFIYGDAFDWLRRFARKGRRFELILLDPPTFSGGKQGTFRAEADYPRLVGAAAGVLSPGGVLLASTNAGGLAPGDFCGLVEETLQRMGRRVLARHYAPQPPDFPIRREQPGHLKTLWLKVE
jgi:23S rRNA (cytosine1962-C5)-methyltransferase